MPHWAIIELDKQRGKSFGEILTPHVLINGSFIMFGWSKSHTWCFLQIRSTTVPYTDPYLCNKIGPHIHALQHLVVTIELYLVIDAELVTQR